MAKSKGGKKKSKGKRPKGNTSSSSVDNVNDTQLIWSAADECEHYAALGCHIAKIARCKSDEPSKHLRHNKSKCATQSSSYTCSEYRQMYQTAMQQYPWLLGIERFDPSDYHPEDIEYIPDVAMNDGDEEDEQMILTLTNIKNIVNICYVTVYDVDLWDANGNTLTRGVNSTTTISTENNGREEEEKLSTSATTNRKCTTFIILCPPQTFVHLCSLAPNQTLQPSSTTENKIFITSWSQIDIESDIQPWSFHPKIEDEHPYLLHFPFYGVDNQKEVSEDNNTTTKTSTAYQCTQSEDGQLTHFFHGNHHAIDFACPIGTPLYSPANGVVVQVRDNNDRGKEVSGIAASNMFQWNSIMIQVEDEDVDSTTDPLYVEFVHIQSKSCVVQTGDIVRKGQLICHSGSVGFSPEPHLHLAAYRSKSVDASTVRVRFESIGGSDRSFLPRTGGWYLT